MGFDNGFKKNRIKALYMLTAATLLLSACSTGKEAGGSSANPASTQASASANGLHRSKFACSETMATNLFPAVR